LFVDTSFWVGLLLSADSRHQAARELWQQTRGDGRRFLTTNHVIGETWTVLCRRDGRRAALAVDAFRTSSILTVVHVPPDLEEDAWQWLMRRDERFYSFTDATSFAIMRSEAIREALAFDGDFSAAGFVELRP
jgi:predicted nucleic acid-binding protein